MCCKFCRFRQICLMTHSHRQNIVQKSCIALNVSCVPSSRSCLPSSKPLATTDLFFGLFRYSQLYIPTLQIPVFLYWKVFLPVSFQSDFLNSGLLWLLHVFWWPDSSFLVLVGAHRLSPVMAHGASLVAVHGRGCLVACGILVPQLVLKPCPQCWKVDS